MFKIGEFSRLGRVTVKTLRHYEKLGLLKPARIDEHSGYRYYSAAQLTHLSRIVELKGLGFTLPQVARLLAERLENEELRELLREKRLELQTRIDAGQGLLARVEEGLRQVEGGCQGPDCAVVLKKVEPLWIASVRQRVEKIDMYGPRYGTLFHMLKLWLEKVNIKPLGKMFSIYHQLEHLADVDLEMAVPVTKGVTQHLSGFPISVRELPGEQFIAATHHRGSFHQIAEAYKNIADWLEGEGYFVGNAFREVYLSHPPDGPWSIEIQIPVKKLEGSTQDVQD